MAAMIRDQIAALVTAAIEAAQRSGDLPRVAVPAVSVERTRIAEHGDYATNVAMRLVRATGGKPQEIAQTIVRHLPADLAIGEAAVAQGFINFRLDEDWLRGQVEAILAAGDRFGDREATSPLKIQVEFVSANPTGPAHVGNGRGAALGSTLANVLRAAGHHVETEYYINDAGTQAGTFGRTLYARYQQLFGRSVDVPEGGYPGAYMVEIAEALKAAHGDQFLRPEGEPAPEEIGKLGLAMMVEQIRRDLASLNVEYDSWFYESTLYEGEGNAYERSLEILRERRFVAEREGAIWFTSTDLGEDKDNVLVRSGGAPTYFAADIAYHRNKFIERGFDRVIDIWGADHQGHVSRLKAAVEAIGGDSDHLYIVLYQLVTLKRGGEAVRLSKRAGDIITLREVIDEVGADACRYFFLLRSADSQMEFDVELAKRQSNENPVYYVQYAHARTAGIFVQAAERGIETFNDGDVSRLTQPVELALVRKMLQLPELIDLIATTYEPHHLPHYAYDLARAFTAFYDECKVLGDDLEQTKARLKLTAAAQVVLARVLTLMGISAPERMVREPEPQAVS